jgi:hypothetical protein
MRMPSFSKSYEEWADYLLESEMTVDEVIEKTTSDAVASWLDESRFQIEDVMQDKGVAVATFITQGSIVENPEDEIEEPFVEKETKEGPVKGIRI